MFSPANGFVMKRNYGMALVAVIVTLGLALFSSGCAGTGINNLFSGSSSCGGATGST